MKKKRNQNRAMLPFYLAPITKAPVSIEARKWLAKRICEMRGVKSFEEVTRATGLQPQLLEELEKGNFNISIGGFKKSLQQAYSASLDDLLKEFCQAHQSKFEFEKIRPFDREFYFTIRWKSRSIRDNEKPTQFLIGGVKNRFVWAIPIRGMQSGQAAHIALLELGPGRNGGTATEENVHNGQGIVHAIHGRVDVLVEDRAISLESGHSVYLNPGKPHFIRNREKDVTALLQLTYVGW
jgi:mannose-6-phosphate isomerase-like protein (cupin superfamily)